MFKSYKTDGIILSRRNIGEADKLITLYTREFGKKTVIAKGIRRITSRRAPYLELFSYISLVLHRGKTLDIVTEVENRETFSLLRKKLERIAFVYIALELVNRLTAEGVEQSVVFDRLYDFLRTLNHHTTQRESAQAELTAFKQFLLINLGFIDEAITFSDEMLNDTVESILERPLRSPALLTNIQLGL
ncbi:DNA repair protein RecO [Candidatus Microgenomates bacterium]|nr:MAG: DNA repair protein RecO [Candidatus Microgenomates bacterium]